MNKAIIEIFKKFCLDKEHTHSGELEDAHDRVEGSLCPKKGMSDVISFTIKKENNRIIDIRYICKLCDPYMWISVEVLSRLVASGEFNDVMSISEDAFEKVVQVKDSVLNQHFVRARELLSLTLV